MPKVKQKQNCSDIESSTHIHPLSTGGVISTSPLQTLSLCGWLVTLLLLADRESQLCVIVFFCMLLSWECSVKTTPTPVALYYFSSQWQELLFIIKFNFHPVFWFLVLIFRFQLPVKQKKKKLKSTFLFFFLIIQFPHLYLNQVCLLLHPCHN